MFKVKKFIVLFLTVLLLSGTSLVTIFASNESQSTSFNSWAYKDVKKSSTSGTYLTTNSVVQGIANPVANCLGGCEENWASLRTISLTTTFTSNYQHLHTHALIYRSTGQLYNQK